LYIYPPLLSFQPFSVLIQEKFLSPLKITLSKTSANEKIAALQYDASVFLSFQPLDFE